MQIEGETMETVADFILGGSKSTADGDCSHEIKRRLLLGRKVTNLDRILKSKDITDKCPSSQGYGFSSSHVWAQAGKSIPELILFFFTLSRDISVIPSQPYLMLCDPMDYSTPVFPVHHQLLELAQAHVYLVGDAIQPLILCHSLLLPPSIFHSIRVFSDESVLHIRWPKD